MPVPIVPAPITAIRCTSTTPAIARGLLRYRGQLAARLAAFLNPEEIVLVPGHDERIRPRYQRRQRAFHHPLRAIQERAVGRRIAADLGMQREEDGAVAEDGLATRNRCAKAALLAHLDRAALTGLDEARNAEAPGGGRDRVARDRVAPEPRGAQGGEGRGSTDAQGHGSFLYTAATRAQRCHPGWARAGARGSVRVIVAASSSSAASRGRRCPGRGTTAVTTAAGRGRPDGCATLTGPDPVATAGTAMRRSRARRRVRRRRRLWLGSARRTGLRPGRRARRGSRRRSGRMGSGRALGGSGPRRRSGSAGTSPDGSAGRSRRRSRPRDHRRCFHRVDRLSRGGRDGLDRRPEVDSGSGTPPRRRERLGPLHDRRRLPDIGDGVAHEGPREVLLPHGYPGGRRITVDVAARTERRPGVVATAIAPADPRWTPDPARHPEPADAGHETPAAV